MRWKTARGLLLANDKRYALVIGAEQMSAVLDMQDRNTCVLFGDGAGAAVFELCRDAPYEHVVGVRGDTLIRVGGPCREQRMTMDGQAVFRFAVTTIPQCVNELCQKASVTPDDVDWVICHQANVRILDASIRRLGMPAEKFYRNLDRYANTSAASIPLALDEMQRKGTAPVRSAHHSGRLWRRLNVGRRDDGNLSRLSPPSLPPKFAKH